MKNPPSAGFDMQMIDGQVMDQIPYMDLGKHRCQEDQCTSSHFPHGQNFVQEEETGQHREDRLEA